MQSAKREFISLLRTVSKQGFFPILEHVADKGELRYHEISKAALGSKVVKNRSQVDVALRMLTDLRLLDREVQSTRPPTTSYRVSRKGKAVVELLKQLEDQVS